MASHPPGGFFFLSQQKFQESKREWGLESLGSGLPQCHPRCTYWVEGGPCASPDSLQWRNGCHFLTKGAAKSCYKGARTRTGGSVAIFCAIPHVPDNHTSYCACVNVHCRFHDSVSLHSHMEDPGGSGGVGGVIMDKGRKSQTPVTDTTHLGQQGRHISRLMALEHEHRDSCLFSSTDRSQCPDCAWPTAHKQWTP